MNQHVRALRELCDCNHAGTAPFVIRTRFEREMFGLVVFLSRKAFRCEPNAVNEDAISSFLARMQGAEYLQEARIMLAIGRLFAKFTYLCDTSNWSNDGQDPRVEACRPEILKLCNEIDAIQDAGAR